MVLCAGYGTRLAPLTDERPKPLVPLGDRPLLHHVAERLAAAGIEHVVVNTHHLAELFTGELLAGLPVEATLVREPEILGTAGGLANASRLLAPGDVLVWNGDILAEVDLAALLAAHRDSGALATLAVAPAAAGPGTVGVSADGCVARLRGERYGVEANGYDFVGVQVISQPLRQMLPAAGCLVGDGYQPALRAGGLVKAVALASAWTDIGTVASYLAANSAWVRARGCDGYVAAGARIGDGVELRDSVIGDGAIVTGRGLLHGVVAWPGARLQAPLADAVVTAAGRIVRPPRG